MKYKMSCIPLACSPSDMRSLFFSSRSVMDVNINGKTQKEDQTRAFKQQENKNKIESKAAHVFCERMRVNMSRGLGDFSPEPSLKGT